MSQKSRKPKPGSGRNTQTTIPPIPVARRSPSRAARLALLLVVLMGLAAGSFLLLRSKQIDPDHIAQQSVGHNSDDQFDHAESSPGPSSSPITDGIATLPTPQLARRTSIERDHLDPRKDGWDTEAFAERAVSQLHHLAEVLQQAKPTSETALQQILADDFVCNRLKPDDLEAVFRDEALVVRRSVGPEASAADQPYQGVAGMTDALTSLLEDALPSPENHVHFKVIDVQLVDDAVVTNAYYEANYHTAAGPIQQRATWHCRWDSSSEDSQLRLAEIVADDYEEVATTGHPGPLLADCTTAVLGGNASFRQQVVHGLNHWLSRIEKSHGMYIFASYGMALGDVNGDGLEDVYLCQPGGLPNRLYVQKPDGAATDRSQEAGVDWLDHTSSALLVDLDNDGDQDLVAAVNPSVLVMENDSQGRFRQRAVLHVADEDLYSLSAVDYDEDGDLDIYICVEFASRRAGEDEPPDTFEYHDANDGGANALFRNDLKHSPDDGSQAGWAFTDVTKAVGLDANNRRHSLAAAWEDFDNDGDQDLYVANDYGQNSLYRNDVVDVKCGQN